MMRRSILVVLALAAVRCGGGPGPNPPGPASLTIQNDSQYVLAEVRAHEAPSYGDVANVLESPLEIGESILLHVSGQWRVTVFRERFSGGPLVALTTASVLELSDSTGYELIVFDESFRLSAAEWIPLPPPQE
jgi:hypothetical protein